MLNLSVLSIFVNPCEIDYETKINSGEKLMWGASGLLELIPRKNNLNRTCYKSVSSNSVFYFVVNDIPLMLFVMSFPINIKLALFEGKSSGDR